MCPFQPQIWVRKYPRWTHRRGGALTEGGFVSINQHPLCLRPVTFPEVSGRKLPPSGRLSFHFAIHSMVPVLVGMTSCDYKFPLINKVSWSFLFPHSRLEASCWRQNLKDRFDVLLLPLFFKNNNCPETCCFPAVLFQPCSQTTWHYKFRFDKDGFTALSCLPF